LSREMRENDLFDEFNRFGMVDRVDLIRDRRTGESKRFAFIYMNKEEDSKKAKEELTGLMGEAIRIDFSHTAKPHSPTPGRYMGKITRPRYKNRYPYDSYRRSPDRGGYDSYYSRRRESSYDRDRYDDRYYDDYNRRR